MNEEGFFLEISFNNPNDARIRGDPPLVVLTAYFHVYRAEGNNLQTLP